MAGTAAFHLTEPPEQAQTAPGCARSAPRSPREVEEPAGCSNGLSPAQGGLLSHTLQSWGTRPHDTQTPLGSRNGGSTAAHRKVISKSRSACSQAPGRLDPFLERGSSATSRNRQTLTSQVGDHRKGRPRAPHHTHPSERWRWVGAGLWDKPARAVLSLAGQHKCKRFCGTTVEENKAKLCKAWVGSGR